MLNCEVKLLRTLWLKPALSMVETIHQCWCWGLASPGLRLQGAAPWTDRRLGKATKGIFRKLLVGNHTSQPVVKLPSWGLGQIPPV